MAKKAKKNAKKPVRKAAPKQARKQVKRKAARTAAKPRKAARKSAGKSPGKSLGKSAGKTARRGAAAVAGLPGQLILHVDPGLVERLANLGSSMAKTMDQVIAQALGEFADTWEDHTRTVATLNAEDDRAVLAVRPDKTVLTDTPKE